MSETRWLDPEEMRAWQSYIRATKRVLHAFETTLQEATGLIPDDYAVLMKLSDAQDHRQLMSELAERLLTPTSSMTYRVDRLEKRGYVCRESCPTDRRSSYAVLTPMGLKALEQAAPVHVTSVRDNLINHLTREQFLTLGEILEHVAEAHDPTHQRRQTEPVDS